jgi:hypothetical protein
MKKLLISISLIFISIVVFGQEQSEQSFHFGLKACPSLAWLRSDTKGFDSDGSKTGFIYGLITDFNFASRYAFSTGIDIDYRGGKFKTVQELKNTSNEDSVISTNSTFSLQYIEIPITLKFKTNEIGSITYYMQIGVSPGFNIRARGDYESTTQNTVSGTVYKSNASDEKVDIQENINNLNVSMILGGGLEYTLSGSTVLIGGIQFSNGFTDVFDTDAKVNSNYLALTLGILF